MDGSWESRHDAEDSAMLGRVGMCPGDDRTHVGWAHI